ncbi:MAG: ABC transporter ATP-binding protein, partial [Lacticaseibacillus paracasei]
LDQEPPIFKISPSHSAATLLLQPGAPKVELPREFARGHEFLASKHQDEKVVN